jgi:tetrahydromethanopterin S-methyltransferase subunit G
MTAQPWDPRLARLEGIYEQVDKRLDSLDRRLDSVRVELKVEIAGVRTDLGTEFGSLRTEITGLRTDYSTQIGQLRAHVDGQITRLDRKITVQNRLLAGWSMILVTALGLFLHH